MERRITHYETVFVDYIPKDLEQGVLYISVKFNVGIHLCACGCGEEIVTPIDRKDGWIMTYDGYNVSLTPSIGNGRYECHSHYYLRNGIVEWLPKFGEHSIEDVQKKKSWFKRLASIIRDKQ